MNMLQPQSRTKIQVKQKKVSDNSKIYIESNDQSTNEICKNCYESSFKYGKCKKCFYSKKQIPSISKKNMIKPFEKEYVDYNCL